MADWKKNLEDVITKWEKMGLPPSNKSENLSDGNKFGAANRINRKPPQRTVRRRRQLRNKDEERWFTKDAIAPSKFKLIAPVLKAPRQTYTIKTCMKCENHDKSRDFIGSSNNVSHLFDILDIAGYGRRKQLRSMLMSDLPFVMSRKSHDYPFISVQNVIKSKRVSDIMQNQQFNEEKDGSNSLQRMVSVAASIHKKMVASISNVFLRFTAWVLLKLFRKIFASICCQTEDFDAIKMASKNDVPMVYLPLHKSHLDYVIISFILFCNDIQVPYTAAGDNLSGSSLLGYWLHKMGAFFIKRKKSDQNDHLYNSVLQEYIEQLLKQKKSIQIFIEGTRSRTGKPSQPKIGILSILTNAVTEGVVDDFMIVPVNISYDRIPESDTYALELLGNQKEQESIWNLIKSLYKLFTSLNGRIHVRFGKPKSFEGFCEIEKYFPNAGNSADLAEQKSVRFVEKASTIKTTQTLAQHVIYDCFNNDVITSTSMVSFLLVTKYRSGVIMEDLVDSFDWLKTEIENLNGYFGFIGSTPFVVQYAVRILFDQNLVAITSEDTQCSITNSCYITINEALDRFLSLVFYSNQVASLFFKEAIIASALIGVMGGVSLVQSKQTLTDSISRDEILSSSRSLCKLLKREHNFFPPCKDLDGLLSDVLDSFIASGMLDDTTTKTGGSLMNRNVSDWDVTDEAEDSYGIETHVQYKVNTSSQTCSKLLHLNAIIAPYLETYWLVASSLPEVLGANHIEENDLVTSVHLVALRRVEKGLSQYAETASLVTIKNAIKTFEIMTILERNADNHGGNKDMFISSEYSQAEVLNSFLHDINICW